jgi:hypothetical protein
MLMRIKDIVDEFWMLRLRFFNRPILVEQSDARLGPKGMRPQPRLSKSRYIAGLQCARRLWLGWHDPGPRPEPEPGSILAVGTDVGVAARQIVPGGVLVEEGPEQHAEAVERTRELIEDRTVPAIFEAAFAFNNVLVRADILERLPGGKWRLAEVKSTKRVKPEHMHDLAVQTYVIAGSGLTLEEMHLVHVDANYARGKDGIDWQAYFKREDLTAEVRELLPLVPERVAEMHAVMAMPEAPNIKPSRHCFAPHDCEFWARCTANKPADWIIHVPRLSQVAFSELDAAGVESMRNIPPEFPLSPTQQRVVDAVLTGRPFVANGLCEALASLGPPASYLDFETFSPTLPIFAGTSPFNAFRSSVRCITITALASNIVSTSLLGTSTLGRNSLRSSWRLSRIRSARFSSTPALRRASFASWPLFCPIYQDVSTASSDGYAISYQLSGSTSATPNCRVIFNKGRRSRAGARFHLCRLIGCSERGRCVDCVL